LITNVNSVCLNALDINIHLTTHPTFVSKKDKSYESSLIMKLLSY